MCRIGRGGVPGDPISATDRPDPPDTPPASTLRDVLQPLPAGDQPGLTVAISSPV
jgi:hypothetical protein